MDYRNRKYYLVTFNWQSYEMRMMILKIASPSLKISPPYNHFKHGRGYDGACTTNSYWQMLVSCRREDSDAIECELRKAARNEKNSMFLEINKEMCGQ